MSVLLDLIVIKHKAVQLLIWWFYHRAHLRSLCRSKKIDSNNLVIHRSFSCLKMKATTQCNKAHYIVLFLKNRSNILIKQINFGNYYMHFIFIKNSHNVSSHTCN